MCTKSTMTLQLVISPQKLENWVFIMRGLSRGQMTPMQFFTIVSIIAWLLSWFQQETMFNFNFQHKIVKEKIEIMQKCTTQIRLHDIAIHYFRIVQL